ncbi:MAG: undecaprenyl-diphosphate phosphatase [Thermoguttaceae bacterium]|nr:undecaprenyl-diphosphate phosphatase [Thermoguttaceae bacterium]
MIYLQTIFMAILQGITEFLPVSSSGHMAFLNQIFARAGWGALEEPVTLEVLLHLASLMAILCYYWRPVLRMLMGNDWQLVKLLFFGTIPVGIVGILAKVFFEEEFDAILQNVQVTGAMMLVTAGLLILAQKLSRQDPKRMHEQKKRRNLKTLSPLRAFGIGCVQALAVLPGLSRSGSTITAGLQAGLTRQQAGSFSFLLAIPAIGAAGAVEVLKLLKNGVPSGVGVLPLSISFVVCFVVSLCSLALLVKILRTRCIGWFAVYLIPVGILMLVL